MPRSIYQVQRITIVLHLDGVAFNGDTTLFFQVHIVQDLVFHIAFIHRTCYLKHTISQRAFAVINMCNDAKISYLIHSFDIVKVIMYYALLCAAKLQKKCHFSKFSSFNPPKTPKFTLIGRLVLL